MTSFMESIIAITAIVCLFGVPFIAGAYVLVKLITSNKKERMELARHGIIPPQDTVPPPNKYRSLRNGILCIGIAIGLMVGILIIDNYNFEDYIKLLIVTSSTIMMMGIAYIAFYLIVKNKDIDNNEE